MSAFTLITVPLDGSELAEGALPAARQLARRSEGMLHLVRVHSQLPDWRLSAEIVALNPSLEEQITRLEETYLESVASRLRGEGFRVSCQLGFGSPIQAIGDLAIEAGSDLIVMTSHGRGGLRRFVLGSVADGLVRQVSIPVLVVQPRSGSTISSAWPRRTLVPLDGSALAASALEPAKALAGGAQGELMLASVVQITPPFTPPVLFPTEETTEPLVQRELRSWRYLEKLKKGLQAEGIRVQTRVRSGTKVAREILRLAESEDCDLIAIATHGAGGIDRVMLGSVADQVRRHASVPVLVIHPPVDAETESIKAAEGLHNAALMTVMA